MCKLCYPVGTVLGGGYLKLNVPLKKLTRLRKTKGGKMSPKQAGRLYEVGLSNTVNL